MPPPARHGEQSIRSPAWAHNPRVTRNVEALHAGFRRAHDLLTREEIENDPVQHALRQACLEAEVDTFIPMPGGEIACFSFQCWPVQGLHTDGNSTSSTDCGRTWHALR